VVYGVNHEPIWVRRFELSREKPVSQICDERFRCPLSVGSHVSVVHLSDIWASSTTPNDMYRKYTGEEYSESLDSRKVQTPLALRTQRGV